jgi:hypothetical protein
MEKPPQALLLCFALVPQSLVQGQGTAPWEETLETHFGKIMRRGKFFPFAHTAYYEAEMGANLLRTVIGFETLISPEEILTYKLKAIEIEKDAADIAQHRTFNLDIGYMDADKVVLPSTKKGPFKLYAGRGLWLDMLLTYAKGRFSPTPWAFADFAQNPYEKDLLLIREGYKKLMKA